MCSVQSRARKTCEQEELVLNQQSSSSVRAANPRSKSFGRGSLVESSGKSKSWAGLADRSNCTCGFASASAVSFSEALRQERQERQQKQNISMSNSKFNDEKPTQKIVNLKYNEKTGKLENYELLKDIAFKSYKITICSTTSSTAGNTYEKRINVPVVSLPKNSVHNHKSGKIQLETSEHQAHSSEIPPQKNRYLLNAVRHPSNAKHSEYLQRRSNGTSTASASLAACNSAASDLSPTASSSNSFTASSAFSETASATCTSQPTHSTYADTVATTIHATTSPIITIANSYTSTSKTVHKGDVDTLSTPPGRGRNNHSSQSENSNIAQNKQKTSSRDRKQAEELQSSSVDESFLASPGSFVSTSDRSVVLPSYVLVDNPNIESPYVLVSSWTSTSLCSPVPSEQLSFTPNNSNHDDRYHDNNFNTDIYHEPETLCLDRVSISENGLEDIQSTSLDVASRDFRDHIPRHIHKVNAIEHQENHRLRHSANSMNEFLGEDRFLAQKLRQKFRDQTQQQLWPPQHIQRHQSHTTTEPQEFELQQFSEQPEHHKFETPTSHNWQAQARTFSPQSHQPVQQTPPVSQHHGMSFRDTSAIQLQLQLQQQRQQQEIQLQIQLQQQQQKQQQQYQHHHSQQERHHQFQQEQRYQYQQQQELHEQQLREQELQERQEQEQERQEQERHHQRQSEAQIFTQGKPPARPRSWQQLAPSADSFSSLPRITLLRRSTPSPSSSSPPPSSSSSSPSSPSPSSLQRIIKVSSDLALQRFCRHLSHLSPSIIVAKLQHTAGLQCVTEAFHAVKHRTDGVQGRKKQSWLFGERVSDQDYSFSGGKDRPSVKVAIQECPLQLKPLFGIARRIFYDLQLTVPAVDWWAGIPMRTTIQTRRRFYPLRQDQ